ncbi:hypothetical protein ATCCBAA256_18330 [Mycobacterium montefiorense]|nr:hypothetical protein ATCCBAA256_18330 [Mycobacterium montefiorense]
MPEDLPAARTPTPADAPDRTSVAAVAQDRGTDSDSSTGAAGVESGSETSPVDLVPAAASGSIESNAEVAMLPVKSAVSKPLDNNIIISDDEPSDGAGLTEVPMRRLTPT